MQRLSLYDIREYLESNGTANLFWIYRNTSPCGGESIDHIDTTVEKLKNLFTSGCEEHQIEFGGYIDEDEDLILDPNEPYNYYPTF